MYPLPNANIRCYELRCFHFLFVFQNKQTKAIFTSVPPSKNTVKFSCIKVLCWFQEKIDFVWFALMEGWRETDNFHIFFAGFSGFNLLFCGWAHLRLLLNKEMLQASMEWGGSSLDPGPRWPQIIIVSTDCFASALKGVPFRAQAEQLTDTPGMTAPEKPRQLHWLCWDGNLLGSCRKQREAQKLACSGCLAQRKER